MSEATVRSHDDGCVQYQEDDTHGWVTWTGENDEIDEWHLDLSQMEGARVSGIHCVRINREGHVRTDIGPENYDDWTSMAFWFESEEETHAFFELVRKAKRIEVGDEDNRIPCPLSEEEQDDLIERLGLGQEG